MNAGRDWIDNSNDCSLQFDYFPAAGWDDPRVASAQSAMAGLIDACADTVDTAGTADMPGWLRLVRTLPDALRHALVAELRAGNYLTGVGSSGWPEPGSVVVRMRERFTVARSMAAEGVQWRALDDPQYAREEVMQRLASTSHLLLA